SWLNQLQLTSQPLVASRDFQLAGLLVNAAPAARLELEMLDGVRDVREATFDVRLLECCVEQLARRSDKGTAGDVLLIARLFADEDDTGRLRSFAPHCLRRVLPQRA